MTRANILPSDKGTDRNRKLESKGPSDNQTFAVNRIGFLAKELRSKVNQGLLLTFRNYV